MKPFLAACLSFVALFPAMVDAPAAYAQGTEVAIVSANVTDTFPDGVEFNVVAETAAPAEIREIKLQMKIKGSNRSSYDYLKFTPATRVEGTYLLKTSGAQYKPPGILIEYNYVVTDSRERTLETPKESHLYLDSRFEWNRVADGLVDVYYYGPTRTRAETIMKAGAQAFERMGAVLGATQNESVRILVYNTARDLIPAQPFESETSERELLLEGVTLSEYGVFLMIGGLDRPDGVASHEMTHIVIGQLLKNSFVDVPAWLSEGLAEYGNVNRDSTFDTALSRAVAQQRILPLRSMQAPPGIVSDRLLMYGQGYAVVKFMVDTYGEGKLKELFGAFKKGQRIDAALQSVYGFNQDGLDNAWRASLGLSPVEPPAGIPAAPSPATTSETEGAGVSSATIIAVVVMSAVVIGLLVFLLTRRGQRSSGQ